MTKPIKPGSKRSIFKKPNNYKIPLVQYSTKGGKKNQITP